MKVNIGELLEKLKTENIETNERAAGELKTAALENAADFQTTETISALIELIDYSPSWNMRQTVLFILDRLAPKETVSVLLDDFKNTNKKIREEAAKKFTRTTESMFPALVREIKSRAISALLEAAQSEDWFVAASSISVLGRIKSKRAIPIFTKALDSENDSVRDEAAIALENLGGAAAAAVPRLIEALNDPTANSYAAQALGKIGAAAIEAVPFLKAAARRAEENGDDELSRSAKEAIEKIVALDKRRRKKLAKANL